MNLLICLALTCGTLTLRQIDTRIAERQTELDRTRRDLQDLRERLVGLSQAESTSLGRLETLREQIAVTRRHVNQLNEQIESRISEIATATREIEATTVRLNALKDRLSRRVVTLYRYGRLLPLRAALDAGSATGALRRAFYLRWVARTDRRLADELTSERAELAARQARLFAARTDLEGLREEHLREARQLQVAEDGEAAVLNRLRSERAAQRKVESELAAAVERLQELIRSLEQQRVALETPDDDHHFVVNKGKLPWPISGEVIARFGTRVHPRYRTTTANNGIDIATRTGSPVTAIHEGRVVYADQFLGYGRLAILDHGGGFYTLYGNLDAISVTVGSEVTTGGEVGRARDYLHFEIRRAGQPVDPLQWLVP